MDYLILTSNFVIWLAALIPLLIIRKNITPLPAMTPERALCEAEIAAKSVGYWEKRGLAATDSEECEICLKGLMKAQERLILLTGDYVPDEAKQVFH